MAGKLRDNLLWWVALAFALLIAAWTTFFVIAARNKVDDVPLAPKGGHAP